MDVDKNSDENCSQEIKLNGFKEKVAKNSPLSSFYSPLNRTISSNLLSHKNSINDLELDIEKIRVTNFRKNLDYFKAHEAKNITAEADKNALNVNGILSESYNDNGANGDQAESFVEENLKRDNNIAAEELNSSSKDDTEGKGSNESVNILKTDDSMVNHSSLDSFQNEFVNDSRNIEPRLSGRLFHSSFGSKFDSSYSDLTSKSYKYKKKRISRSDSFDSSTSGDRIYDFIGSMHENLDKGSSNENLNFSPKSSKSAFSYSKTNNKVKKSPGRPLKHPLERRSFRLSSIVKKPQYFPSRLFTSKFDYVMIFPMKEIQNSTPVQYPNTKFVVHSMINAGLEVFPYLSSRANQLIVLIRSPLNILEDLADKIGFKLLADPAVLYETLEKGNPQKKISSVKIKHDTRITKLSPYEYIYLKFQKENDMRLYQIPEDRFDPFIKSVRLKLIYHLLTAPKRYGGVDLEISKMIHLKGISHFYPLHDLKTCDELLTTCTAWDCLPWNFPIDELREYFGEKITLYIHFLGFISYWLIVPGILGAICQAVVLGTLNFSHPILPFFSFYILVWSISLLVYWRREESRTSLRWGMTDYVENETDRPEFKGELHINSHIDGKEMLYFPKKDFRNRLLFSLSMIATFILLVIGVIIAIYIVRFSLQANIGLYASAVASGFNVCQIITLNFVYQIIAVKLTNQENHRTDTQYENALIAKIFVFQFINSYASFFYLAFIAQYLAKSPNDHSDSRGQCGFNSCMQPLAINLGLIFIAKMTAKNALDLFIPYIRYLNKIRIDSLSFSENKEITPAELDYMLMEYNTILESVRSYADSAVQYGLTVLFISALPFASFLSLLSNYIKIKSHIWKLLTLYQRPIPKGAQNIESWDRVYSLISVISVVTNSAIICFTMDILNGYSTNFKFWVFVGFQWLFVSLHYLVDLVISREPEEVKIQKARIKSITEKVIDKIEDEDYDKEAIQYDSDESDESDDIDDPEIGQVIQRIKTQKSNRLHNPLNKNLKRSTRLYIKEESNGLLKYFSCTNANLKSTHLKKMHGDILPQVPLLEYPTSEISYDWPDPLRKENLSHSNYKIFSLGI